MKIDQDLRAAIRSAEKAQPSSDYQKKRAQERASIAEFFTRCPSKTRQVLKLVHDEIKANDASEAARADLCKRFGLRTTNLSGNLDDLEFSKFGKGKEQFSKAGGKPPSVAGQRWNFDAVMAELAAAEPKQLTAILKKYGINWR